MLMHSANNEMVAEWKRIWKEYRDKLCPNRKSGEELVFYLTQKYPVQERTDSQAIEVVVQNVMQNDCFSERLPAGVSPVPMAFTVENAGAGEELYRQQDKVFEGSPIFVGIEQQTGFFCVEGSSLLWDELFAFRGLDEKDLENFYLVAEYVNCLKRFGRL